MEREIKFRGVCQRTGKWKYGYLSNKNVINTSTVRIKVIPESVGQFTGLKDKNGVEIYEGDQLYSTGYLCEVVFYDGCFRTVYKHPEDGEILILVEDISPSGMEVMGNIHELKP